MCMIEVRNITKSFDNNIILENVSLEVNQGEAVVIIGGSGCGKSTLLRCMNRLITPEKGEVFIDGENILDPKTDIDRVRRKMGMVYQNFNLFSHLNVIDNITLAPMKVAGVTREAAEAEASQLLKRVGLVGHEYHMPDSLSGGQKQRVAIARALAMHPEVILFDEPTSALDPTMVDEVETVIRDLIRDGMTSVIVTHEMRFARNIATKVIFLAEKGIYEQGSVKDVFDYPQKVLTQRFLYRSRMFETTLKKEEMDLPSLATDLKGFLRKHESTSAQLRLITIINDELIIPVMNTTETCKLIRIKMLCSETGTGHILHINFPGLESDPLQKPFLDEINTSILEHYTGFILSKNTGNDWTVSIHL